MTSDMAVMSMFGLASFGLYVIMRMKRRQRTILEITPEYFEKNRSRYNGRPPGKSVNEHQDEVEDELNQYREQLNRHNAVDNSFEEIIDLAARKRMMMNRLPPPKSSPINAKEKDMKASIAKMEDTDKKIQRLIGEEVKKRMLMCTYRAMPSINTSLKRRNRRKVGDLWRSATTQSC